MATTSTKVSVSAGYTTEKVQTEQQDTVPAPESSIDSISEALQLLELELPDFEEELVTQVRSLPLDTFTCFPKLGIELRYMIWKLTFPGRRCISLSHVKHYLKVPIGPKLPTSLHINRESRSYTLETFHLLWLKMHRTGSKRLFSRLICMNPALDLVHVDFISIQGRYRLHRLRELFQKYPESIAAIRSLEIREIIHPAFLRDMKYDDESDYIWEDPRPNSPMQWFKGLRNIHLVADWRISPTCKWYSALVYKIFIREVKLTRIGTKYSELPNPALVIHQWRRLEVRSDYDNLHDAALPDPWPKEQIAIFVDKSISKIQNRSEEASSRAGTGDRNGGGR
ncbi:hypothetical protein MBM_05668 [Drepanopeziza brunnea f. sp. 'multigermtubi' MB_m1]|uniref:2EXR domain-containing protein n=1 Tax=Marssonina brunnea f. sp. multigermtubi (strain MB_m1) TaxID=1072389 RepID=K1XUH9_MARBU|nr:uncharacterized protein MBM_05668 [Drepanopeziza brunnea f. sp. 'multigermtubi' MB_m1]EKD16374.1 hypothetical protein MBM_05668 [Drepanopeziza brunnea f. sp. 'multigermtubi' MB_m1]